MITNDWNEEAGVTHAAMSHLRFGHITDLHLPPLNRIPEGRNEKYFDHLALKHNAMVDMLNRREPAPYSSVLISGDFFHLKKQSLYIPRDLNHYAKLFNRINPPKDVIAGNHDLPASNVERIEESSLYNLYRSANLDMFDAQYALHEDVPETVKGVKWQAFRDYVEPMTSTKADGTQITIYNVVTVSGISYRPLEVTLEHMAALSDMYKARKAQIVQKLKQNDPSAVVVNTGIVMLHTDAMPNDDIPVHWKTMTFNTMLETLREFDVVCLGHIHTSFDVFVRDDPETKRRQFVSKPWALGRVVKDYFATTEILEQRHAPSMANIDIKVKYCVLPDGKPFLSKNVEIAYEVIPHAPAEETFSREGLSQAAKRSQGVQSFTEVLKQRYGSTRSAFSIESPTDILDNMRLPKEVLDEVAEYLK